MLLTQSEVVGEIARDIHREFMSSCTRVRDAISSALRDVFFQSTATRDTKVESTKTPAPAHTKTSTASELSYAIFSGAFEQLKSTRQRRSAERSNDGRESVQPYHLRTQHIKETGSAAQIGTEGAALQQSAASTSPTKKRFGFFGSSKPSESLPSVPAERPVPREFMCNRFVLDKNKVTVVELSTHSSGDRSLASTAKTEKNLWQRMLVEVDRVAIPSSYSHPSSIEVSSDAGVCVIGTTTGEVLLWDLRRQPPLLLRSYTPPSKAARASISRVSLSISGTRILTLNQLKAIHVLSTQRTSASRSGSEPHTSDCFAVDDLRKWKPLPLELLMELTSDALAQPALSEEVRKMVPTEKSTVLPPQFVSICFHSSFTLLGEQTSVVCGISDGDILKINMGETHPSDIAARFDAPLPSDLGTKELRTRDIKREFFCGHKHSVLFVLSRSAKNCCKILSIDSDANVTDWKYDAGHFSGFGWFSLARQYHLNLHTRDNEASSTESRGTILQIASTADKMRVVLMVFYAASNIAAKKMSGNNSGMLRFYQVLTDSVQLLPTLIQLDVLGTSSAPPRFALTTALPATKKSKTSGASDHFLFLLMNNTVQILSLSSGESCCAPIQLQQANNKSSLVFNAISVSSHCMRIQEACCSMVVAGDHHSKVLVYRFKQQKQEPESH